MKIKDLIIELKQLDQDLEVVMSCDSEGNNYSPLAGLHQATYVPESTWSGYLVDESDSDQVLLSNALVLYPVN